MSASSGEITDDEKGKAHGRTLRTLITYLWPPGRTDLKARVVIAMAFLVAAKVVTVYVPFLLKDAVDILAGERAVAIVVPVALLLAYGVGRVAMQAFGELRDAVFAKVGQHAIRTVALETFRHLHALSLRFHLERQTGGLSRAIERGTKGIEFLLRFSLFNVLPTVLEIGFVCIILLVRYDVAFAAITLVTVVAYIAFTLLITDWRIKYRRSMNRADSDANTKAIDSLLNYETVKYFGNEAHEARRFDKAIAAYEKAAVNSQTSLAALNIGQGVIIAFGQVSVLYLAARGIVDGSLTIGDFFLVNAFLMQLYMPLNFLGFVYREIKQSLVDMEKMFDLLAIGEEISDPPEAGPLAAGPGEVRFEHVSFGYESRRPILKDISFVVPAGAKVAIVGPSGAGKSTISRILFRFYDVQDGRVTIDGQDIRDVTQQSVRAAVGIVPQDTVLFNDTIRYNIRYGRPAADDAAVAEAARMAHIEGFIESLPDGFETMVGERGLKLSGGEKQRVAIARTILKDPRILLLDEATSALDSATEREIQANLLEVSRNRTTLVIAHRLSTVVDADEILVLDAGRIVERGRHDALLALDGQYAAMWRRQQQAADIQKQLREYRETFGVAPPLEQGVNNPADGD
ncbi:ABCB family ABC transporter ATP-binding protein/permease [Oceanibacterium hippocampi]|uniref:Putative ABC transporter ATP-binding protein n=1 Tax=Oceanibacterium hippocampi TaxID=745714 RepID=A0A1Y5TYA9_9PROT|nr:ABC transporter ATP-binding protein/permease [Oceanibacterium hippocampi]SLN76857.1 putative ABC transporter ATP-binding protein [Oceanibacterium hippocampi]